MKKIVCIVVLIIFGGCYRVYVTKTPNKYLIARKLTTHMSKTNYNSAILISRLYILSCFDEVRWLRFYVDGRVSEGLAIIHPNSNRIDTLSQAGYYQLEGDELTMQITAGGKFQNSWSYLVVKGNIVGDTIKFYKDQWSGWGKNAKRFSDIKDLDGKACYYVESKKAFTPRLPDW